MADYKINCEVVKVLNGAKCQNLGDCFTIWKRTPSSMCCRAFMAVYPPALGMRFSEEMDWESEDGYLDVMCPDQNIVYRLSRIKEGNPLEK